MLKFFAKPHGIVALVLVLFAIAWAVWTFVWLPQAEVERIDPGAVAPGAAGQ